MTRKNEIGILGTGIHQGQKKLGVEKAYGHLIQSGLLELIKDKNIPFKNFGDLDLFDCSREEALRQLNLKVKELVKTHFPLLIGGDHSQSFATVSAMLDIYPDLHIIWLDAHGDINTPETSPSGNWHGMPLSALAGLVEKSYWDLPWLNQSLPCQNIALIGIRDLDQGEKDIIKKHKVPHFTTFDVHKIGMEKVILEVAKSWGNVPVFISYDIDALDPKYLPATGTPVDFGFSLEDIKNFYTVAQNHLHLVGLEIVEFNPELANSKEELKISTDSTLRAILDFL